VIPAILGTIARVGASVGRIGATAARAGGSAAMSGAKQGVEVGTRSAVAQLTMGAISHTQSGSRRVPPDQYDDSQRY